MKKRLLTVLLVLLFSFTCLFAAEWWENKRISSYEVNGTVNIAKNDITSILYDYKGKLLTNTLLSEIESKIYAISGVDYITTSVSEKSGQIELIIDVYELPQIQSITYEGNSKIKKNALNEGLSKIAEGNFFDTSKKSLLDQAASEIKTLYLNKGYSNIKVTPSYKVQDNGKIAVKFEISEGSQTRVISVAFEGNNSITDSTLKKEIKTSVKGLFNNGYYIASTVTSDAEAIANYYKTLGYIDVVIKDVIVEPVESNDKNYDAVSVKFVIDEGLMWYYGGMEVTGNHVFTDQQIESVKTVPVGSVLNLEKIMNQYTAIEDLYMDEGYMYNKWDLTSVRDDKNMTVKYFFDITEGPQAIIEEIWISGLTTTQEYVMRRELSIKEGDPFSKTKFVTSARSLYNTGLLSNLDYKTYAGTGENSVIVEFLLEEGSQKDISFGATFGGETTGFPISGFLQWADRNFRGKGQQVNVNAKVSPTAQSLTLSFGDSWFRDLRWANNIGLSGSRTKYTGETILDPTPDEDGNRRPSSETFDYTMLALSLDYTTGYSFVWDPGTLSISGGLSVSLNKANFEEGIVPYNENLELYGQRPRFSNKLTIGASWDGRDKNTNTTRGYIASANATYAGGILRGISNYIKLSASASAYQKLAEFTVDEQQRNLMFCATSNVSAMLPQYSFEKSDWIRPKQGGATDYEMLYIDGMTTARGHESEMQLEFMFDNIFEVSFPLVENVVNLEAFASATGVNKELKEVFNGLDWYFAAGVGAKLKVSGFPLGIYLVKDFTYIDKWNFDLGGDQFGGMKFVLAISTSLI